MIGSLVSSPGILVLLPSAFWMLMIVDCVRNEPDRQTWIWVLLFLNVVGALIYFFVCWLPRSNVPVPNYFKRWTMRQALWNAEAGVRNIGKAHQYIALGNVLTEIGELAQATEAFQQALDKEPQNIHALWGLAFIEMQHKQFAFAREHLAALIKLDADYKCGEASLLYGKALFELQDWDVAKPYLEQDLKYWSHPESALMLASIHRQEGEIQKARDCLEGMLAKLKAAPIYHYRRHQHTLRKAEKMLKTL
ncbi:tetratricopeptide repeat protein [Pantanalinema rosaneae CENA516]|uniref:tetratricopeptide repeat protein n=1 Tax=Pantanalinema rosaneae TaxID=1620701 RepID=UPI003D6F745D